MVFEQRSTVIISLSIFKQLILDSFKDKTQNDVIYTDLDKLSTEWVKSCKKKKILQNKLTN